MADRSRKLTSKPRRRTRRPGFDVDKDLSWMDKETFVWADTVAGKAILQECCLPNARVAVDTETTSLDPHSCGLLIVSLCPRPGRAVALEVATLGKEVVQTSEGEQLEIDVAVPHPNALKRLALLKKIFSTATLVMQNKRFDQPVLARALGCPVPCQYDTMIASYLEDATPSHGLKQQAKRRFNLDSIEFPEVDFSSPESRCRYACQDAHLTKMLDDYFLAHNGYKHRLYAMEIQVSEVLDEMERNGIKADLEEAERLSAGLDQEITQLHKEIDQLAGGHIELGSPAQVAELLFNKLGLPATRFSEKTSQPSTDKETLKKLRRAHPVVRKIVDCRSKMTMKNTFLDAFPNYVSQDGRVHASYLQTITPTGRLACSDPNLMNYPKVFRTIYTASGPDEWAPDGYLMVECDYKAIEFRLICGEASCQPALRAIAAGLDTHRICAANMYDTPESKVTKDQRDASKTTTYGVIYGMEDWGLAARMECSRAEAQELMAKFFSTWTGLKEFIDREKSTGVRRGGSATRFGRHRSLPDLKTTDRKLVQRALRNVINDRVQGGAADIIKAVMYRVMQVVKSYHGRLLEMNHDALLAEFPSHLAEEGGRAMAHAMRVQPPGLPLMETEAKIGPNWCKMVDLDVPMLPLLPLPPELASGSTAPTRPQGKVVERPKPQTQTMPKEQIPVKALKPALHEEGHWRIVLPSLPTRSELESLKSTHRKAGFPVVLEFPGSEPVLLKDCLYPHAPEVLVFLNDMFGRGSVTGVFNQEFSHPVVPGTGWRVLSVEDLYRAITEAVKGCTECTARLEATNPVVPEGQLCSPIMIVGRNPGVSEDAEGRPFVGKGGVLLDKWLALAKLPREKVYMTNVIKCHTSKDRPPCGHEIEICRHYFLDIEIRAFRPRLIIALGNMALKATTGLPLSVNEVHGRTFKRDDYVVMAMHHPGQILHDPRFAEQAAADWVKLSKYTSKILASRPDGPKKYDLLG